MEDVQARHDDRGVYIQQAGVRDLRYPITVLDRREGKQQTVASVTVAVDVQPDVKGTHMSRLFEVLNDHIGEITLHTIPLILGDLRTRLGSTRARVEVHFTYFLQRAAPVSGATGLMDYDCWFVGDEGPEGDDFLLGVRTPVTSLCPCSKEISDYGAHNQRGFITTEVRSTRDEQGLPEIVWIEQLVELAERSASAPVYPVLKRADERHVTMQAYDNPVFVEDMVRNVANALADDRRISWFRTQAQNQESIHNHDAFAVAEGTFASPSGETGYVSSVIGVRQ